MADKNLNVRLKQKFDTYANWIKIWDSFVPLKGEVIVFEIPSSDTVNGTQTVGSIDKPQHITKTGNGTTNLHNLPWDSALAADVYAWAKAATKPTYKYSEITEKPTALKNPNALDFLNNAGTEIQDYDGSKEIKVKAGDNVEMTINDAGTISISATDTTYDNATTTKAGLMSANDKLKLSNIELTTLSDNATSAVANAVYAETAGAATNYIRKVGGEPESIDDEFTNIWAAFDDYASLASPTFTGTPKAPTAAATTNTTQIATTAFVQNAINNKLSANDAMVFKGTLGTDGTVKSLPATHEAGWTYRVVTAGMYASYTCEVGDMVICIKDGNTDDVTHWTVVQTNIDGAIVGTTGASDGNIVVFQGDSGRAIKDSGIKLADAKLTDTTYTFATGSTNGAFSVTPAGGSAQSVSIKGLAGAAYKGVDTSLTKTTTSTNVPTSKAVVDLIQTFDGITATGTLKQVVGGVGVKITGDAQSVNPTVNIDSPDLGADYGGTVFILDGGSSTVNV